jgi:hypothetical protein
MPKRGLIPDLLTIWGVASGSGDLIVEPGDVNGTSESVAAGGTPTAHTFTAFTGDTSEIASYSSLMVNAIGSTGAAGSGLGPYTYTGHSDGNAFTHILKALNSSGDIIGVAWHSVGIGSSGTGSWETLIDYNLKNVTTDTAKTSGTHTLTIGSDTIDITVTRYSSSNKSVTPTNGSGLVIDGTSGTITVAFDFVSELATWDREELASYKYAIHIVFESLAATATSDSVISGVSTGTNHNSGNSRVFYMDVDGTGPITERWRTRFNTGNSTTIQSAQTQRTSRVVTTLIGDGAVIEVQDANGTTIPTPTPGSALAYMVGAAIIGTLDTTPQYLNCYSVNNLGLNMTGNITRIVVQRYK